MYLKLRLRFFKLLDYERHITMYTVMTQKENQEQKLSLGTIFYNFGTLDPALRSKPLIKTQWKKITLFAKSHLTYFLSLP